MDRDYPLSQEYQTRRCKKQIWPPLPVIGIPAKSSTMDGLDSLLSVVQMPKGVPVATVAIGGGENGGLLAVQMLSIKYPELRRKFKEYKLEMSKEIDKIDEEIRFN